MEYKSNIISSSIRKNNANQSTLTNQMNINRVLLIGNLTVQPELVEVGKTKIVNASLAHHQFFENGQEERQEVTTFVEIKIWGVSAENFVKHARRGQEILVEGALRQDRWEDDQGNKRSKLYVNVSTWQFAQRKNDESAAKSPGNGLAKKR
jgi:single-strand DNA-binding protein